MSLLQSERKCVVSFRKVGTNSFILVKDIWLLKLKGMYVRDKYLSAMTLLYLIVFLIFILLGVAGKIMDGDTKISENGVI